MLCMYGRASPGYASAACGAVQPSPALGAPQRRYSWDRSGSGSVPRWPLAQRSPRGSRRCAPGGFVGDRGHAAGEYHAADFEWEEVREAGEAAVQRQRRELLEHLQQQAARPAGEQAKVALDESSSGAGTVEAALSRAGSDASGASSASGGSWELFHSQHSGRFFKEKRYLALEFPALAVTHPPQRIVEIGCGYGSGEVWEEGQGAGEPGREGREWAARRQGGRGTPHTAARRRGPFVFILQQ